MAYQERLLLYADVLGWSAEIRHGCSSRLLRAVEAIHGYAKDYNEQARGELEGS
jgi:hypothetical protein